MTPENQKAHDALLKFCRSNPRGMGALAMRENRGLCFLINVGSWVSKPEYSSNDWEGVKANLLSTGKVKEENGILSIVD